MRVGGADWMEVEGRGAGLFKELAYLKENIKVVIHVGSGHS